MANFFREEKQQLQEEKQLLRLPTFYYLVYVKPLGFWKFRITSHVILASQISFISASIMDLLFFFPCPSHGPVSVSKKSLVIYSRANFKYKNK